MPVVDAIAPDYEGEITFVAIAGRSTLDKTTPAAGELLSNLPWGLDDSIWELYGIPGQPASVLITGNDIVVDGWFGALPEDEIRAALDQLVAYGA